MKINQNNFLEHFKEAKKLMEKYKINSKKMLHGLLATTAITGAVIGYKSCSNQNKRQEEKEKICKIDSSEKSTRLLKKIFPNGRQPEIDKHIIIPFFGEKTKISTAKEIPDTFINLKEKHSDKFNFNDISYPQVAPELEDVLVELSDRFNHKLQEYGYPKNDIVKITLTSLTRPKNLNDTLKNASNQSTHQYGIAADIKITDNKEGKEDNRFSTTLEEKSNNKDFEQEDDYFMFILAEVLHTMQSEGKIIAMTEQYPPHIHINLAYGYTNETINKQGKQAIDALINENSKEIKKETASPESNQNTRNLRKKPLDLKYQEKFPEQSIHFINFPQVSHSDMIQSKIKPSSKIIRCLRWKPLTDAAEDIYDIPSSLLMAMMAQEGAGDPTLPNVKNWNSIDGKHYRITKSDGGLGLLHIQGANAEDFGLKVLQTTPGNPNSRKMVDEALGDKIIQAYYTHKMDLKKLSEIDERRHPIEAIDCAARFLKSKYKAKNGKDAWIKALEAYSGRKRSDKHSYPKRVLEYRVAIDQYLNKDKASSIPSFTPGVNEYIEQLKKAGLGKQVEEVAKSIEVEIGGKKGGYELYLDYHAKQCENYELEKYIKHATRQ